MNFQYNQILGLLYLVFVLFIFGQQTPYQSLVQEPVQKGFQKASVDYFSAAAIAGSIAEFDQPKSKFPFGAPTYTLGSSSSSSAIPFPQAVFRQAYQTASSRFIDFKPLLQKRWQQEQLSHQNHARFV